MEQYSFETVRDRIESGGRRLRRLVLAAALALAPQEAMADGSTFETVVDHSANETLQPITTEADNESMSVEEMERLAYETLGERFTNRLLALAEMNTMSADHVLFVGPYGEALGEPVPLTDAAGYTPYEMTVSYKEGAPVGIPGVWSRSVRAHLAAQYGLPPESISMLHVYLDVQGAPEGYSRIDVVAEHALKPVAPDDARTRMEYLFSSFHIDNVPEEISEMVRNYILGLAAEESRFDPGVTSAVGAVGILQTMPATTAQYEAKSGIKINPRDLRQQVHVAEYQFEVTYHHFENELSDTFAHITDEFFDGDRTAFNQYFLVPLMINAYNAGQGTMTAVVEEFFARYTTREEVADLLQVEATHGYDLYFAMVHTAVKDELVGNFRQHAGSYFFDVAGFQLPISVLLFSLRSNTPTEVAGSQSDAPLNQHGSL